MSRRTTLGGGEDVTRFYQALRSAARTRTPRTARWTPGTAA